MREEATATITDHILTTEFEVFDDGSRRLAEVRLRVYTQLLTRTRHKSASGCCSLVGCCRARCEALYVTDDGSTSSAAWVVKPPV